ncbi:hypothetical protein [Pelagicoccus sp. SDUM812003]|uniref:hypothetical protein n=1 Tax=Pelagicoccus sp. SDUM812003 TaxID=3041267 RepID=UPI00281020A9|nr:hypothetical protein [Pelagicoccus sp. SDUM812003]MDQ8205292.1 hypothetical protein [Pelagicoccus sp. SDUM812003]
MYDYLKTRLRRSPVKEDALLRHHQSVDGVRNAQFVSFLQQSGFRKRVLNRHEKTKRIKKLVALAFVWSVVLGFAWIAFESAQALELF